MNTTTRPTMMQAQPAMQQNQVATVSGGNGPASRPGPVVAAPSAPAAKAYPPKIAKAILTISRKIQPVKKAGINDFHRYAYPKWEDIRDELWPLVNEQGLIIIQNEITHEGLTTDMIAITYDFAIINEDGDTWPERPLVTAICKIRDAKGMLDDKAASKCRTQAEKNAMVQIFKIRTEDVYEVDQEGKVNKNSPRKARVAPSPDGHFPPQQVPIQQGEEAAAWGGRFKAMLQHARTPEEVDEWYAANERVFNKIAQNEGYKPLYQDLIQAMDARVLALGGAAPQVEQHQVEPVAADSFPGDRPAQEVQKRVAPAPDSTIPVALDRNLSDNEREWIDSLEEAYEQCSTVAELQSEQDSLMMPSNGNVTPHAWARAVELTRKHTSRISADG